MNRKVNHKNSALGSRKGWNQLTTKNAKITKIWERIAPTIYAARSFSNSVQLRKVLKDSRGSIYSKRTQCNFVRQREIFS